ncbi:MAG: DDE transposase family protein [Synechococcales cyanobacterium K44_A2020_017]|nr:DDE transposase family protein [Synechococcales cyanobacterium K32_A2020_035]MBF2094281.1 DDE transposase family protein [Synechococcales cyanobacterium K44_A2020_017]
MSSQPDTWYIVQQSDGQCDITHTQPEDSSSQASPKPKQWGPYASQAEAIAHRIGLIRAGHCRPR